MKKTTDRTLLYIGISLFAIFLGIVSISVINRVKSGSSEVRARASATAGVKYIGSVVANNPDSGTVIVTDVQPYNNLTLNFGQWTVSPPSGYNYATYPVGTNITMTVDPKTFAIDKRTFTAKEIRKK